MNPDADTFNPYSEHLHHCLHRPEAYKYNTKLWLEYSMSKLMTATNHCRRNTFKSICNGECPQCKAHIDFYFEVARLYQSLIDKIQEFQIDHQCR